MFIVVWLILLKKICFKDNKKKMSYLDANLDSTKLIYTLRSPTYMGGTRTWERTPPKNWIETFSIPGCVSFSTVLPYDAYMTSMSIPKHIFKIVVTVSTFRNYKSIRTNMTQKKIATKKSSKLQLNHLFQAISTLNPIWRHPSNAALWENTPFGTPGCVRRCP